MGIGAAYKIGENTKSMILTRALAEMSRFAVKQGANPHSWDCQVLVIYSRLVTAL